MAWSKREEDPGFLDVHHFRNPFSFHLLLAQTDDFLYKWLRDKNFIASQVCCEICTKPCKPVKCGRRKGGMLWRCRGSVTWKHEKNYSVHKYSFFEGTHFDVREVLIFMREWLLGSSLHRCAIESGLQYKNSAVDWANFLRDHCRKFINDLYYERTEKLRGEIEIDESLFGRRTKFHRGDPRGMKIWIFGMVERSTNRLILYPVDRRDEETLLPLIQRHVEKGSTIYSDGWRAYYNLNEHGYSHFTVEHKETFVQRYRNVSTGEIKKVHTNQIEGAWKLAKDHFRKMNGSKVTTFEGHLCEVLWRNRVVAEKKSVITSYCDLLREHYSLRRKPNLEIKVPLFDTWQIEENERIRRQALEDATPNFTVTESPPKNLSDGTSIDIAGLSTADDSTPCCSTAKRLASPPLPSRCQGRKVKVPPKKSKVTSPSSGTLRHPPGFYPVDKDGNRLIISKKGKGKKKKEDNPYVMSNFVHLDWSDDSDFQ